MKCKFLRSQLVKVKIFAAAGEFCKWCKSCFKIEAHHIFGQVAWELSKEDWLQQIYRVICHSCKGDSKGLLQQVKVDQNFRYPPGP